MIVIGVRNLNKKLLGTGIRVCQVHNNSGPIKRLHIFRYGCTNIAEVKIPKNINTIQLRLEGLLWESNPVSYLKWVLSE